MNERPTPETQKATFEILSSLQSGTQKVVHAETCAKIERERDEARRNAEVERLSGVAVVAVCKRQESEIEAMREAIKEAHAALEACMEDSGELLAEHDWWKDEPRCCYQTRYEENKQRIENAKTTLAKLQPFLA